MNKKVNTGTHKMKLLDLSLAIQKFKVMIEPSEITVNLLETVCGQALLMESLNCGYKLTIILPVW